MSNKYCWSNSCLYQESNNLWVHNRPQRVFAASELLPDWPTKKYRPCSLTVNMLGNVAKRKLIKLKEAYSPLLRASYMIFYSVDDTLLPSSVGYSAITPYYF
ncbi:hypothetical protein AVEN_90800-1 [Araneus ventricosus]|uniref:Uncharacterized protein n=1 Tax=Araneus ventricosus TaxID=182803 RepID=A0A4Y2X4U6_ARAVE|nr:hypothetical protein AVEN_90800-1 [Araneus ventricosus]